MMIILKEIERNVTEITKKDNRLMQPQRIKVLQLGKYYHPYLGGIENHQRNLCRSLKESVDVEVVVANTVNKTIKEKIDGIPVKRIRSIFRFASTDICPTFFMHIRKMNPDIVHIHCPNPMGVVSYFTMKKDHKLVVTYHSEILRKRLLFRLYRPVLQKLLERADRILVQTEHNLNNSRLLQPYSNKVAIVPLGIDLEEFRRTAEVDHHTRNFREEFGSRIILFIGRLVPFKGVEYLIDAMRDVEGKLVIIGWGPMEKKLRALAEDLKLKEKILFVTKHTHSEKVAWLYTASALCLSSIERSESFGIAQLEAMACSMPVINTKLDGSGVSYVSIHNETGLTVPPADSEALAGAINILLENKELREKFGTNGRKRVEEYFTKEIMAKRILEIYQELLS